MKNMPVLKREHLAPRISQQLHSIIDRVDRDNDQNLTNINYFLEDVFCFLLNFMHESAHYKNINRITGRQTPAVDLADEKSKTCYQVTSETTTKKIRESIATFESDRHKLYEDYDKLCFILLAKKKPRRKEIEEIDTNGKYAFSYENILDINDVISHINGLSAVVLEQISTFLDSEIVEDDYDQTFSIREAMVVEEVINYALLSVGDANLIVDDDKLITINEKIQLNFKDESERQAVRDIHERIFSKIDTIDENFLQKKPDDINAIQQCVHDVYNKLKAENKKPFEILLEMFNIFTPQDHASDPQYRLAVKAFVLYFFDDCIIFEKTKSEKQLSIFGKVL